MREEIQDAKSVPSNPCPVDSRSCLFAESCVSKAYSCRMCRTSGKHTQRYKPSKEMVILQLRAMLATQQINRLNFGLDKKGAKVAF